MGKIEWNEALSVQVEELDSQHRELFRLYNTLHESLMHDSLEESTRTKFATLNALIDYALHHFTTEERYLANREFPHLESHERLHREFSGRILSLQQDIAANTPVLGTSLMKFLRNWIVDHIARDDQEYARYFRNTITAR